MSITELAERSDLLAESPDHGLVSFIGSAPVLYSDPAPAVDGLCRLC